MSLSSLLQPARVLANVEARSKKHAFEILSELIAGISEDLSYGQVFEGLVERERIGNTGLGKGVAIPHGKAIGLESATAAFLKLSEAVDYGAQDGEPVSLILAIAVPDNDEADSFEDVAKGANALADPKLIHMLSEVSSSRALYELLAAYLPHGEDETSETDPAQGADSPGEREDSYDGERDNQDDAASVD